MAELSDLEKFNAKKVMDALIDYMWSKVLSRMIEFNETSEEATIAVMKEAMEND